MSEQMEWDRLSLCLHGPARLAARAAPPNQRQSKRGVRAAPCTPSALEFTDSEKVWPSRSCVFLLPPCLGGKPPRCDLPAWPACLLACSQSNLASTATSNHPPSVQVWVRFYGHRKAIYHDPMPMLMLTRPSVHPSRAGAPAAALPWRTLKGRRGPYGPPRPLHSPKQ
jgi:hypothetical protein